MLYNVYGKSHIIYCSNAFPCRLQGEPSNYKFFVTHQKIISTFRPLDKIVAFKQKCKALNMIKVPSVMCESVETLKLKKKNKCTTF